MKMSIWIVLGKTESGDFVGPWYSTKPVNDDQAEAFLRKLIPDECDDNGLQIYFEIFEETEETDFE